MAIPLHLLILEDNPSDAELLLHLLRRGGYQPIGDRVETEQDFRDHLHPPPQIILADFSMPELDALRALEILQENHLEIPFIIISGTIGEDRAVEMMRAGAGDYLLKGNLLRLPVAIERALREAENRRLHRLAEQTLARDAMLLANVQDSIVVTDLKGLVTYWNEGATRMFGWTDQEMLGRPLVERLPEQARPAVYTNIQAVMGGTEVSGERENYRKDGSRFWTDVRIALIRDRDGKPVGIIGVSHDINDRKRAEAELLRSNTDLEQFAYVAAHDLQEPLRKVVGYTQLLSDLYKGRLDADADEFIGYSVDGAKRMQALIQDLLAYSRVGRKGQEPAQTNCETVLAKSLLALGEAVRESNAKVTHGALPTLVGNEPQLVQLFQNLIGNAIKFHGPFPPQIHVSGERSGANWLFTVADNGIGIDPLFADRVFVIFQRLHNRSDYPGTGIGLAICKKIVDRHEGRIWVESRPGGGSFFKFTLPTGEPFLGNGIP